MSYSYDHRAAVPPSLGHRSGYELRVIAFLSAVWPFQVQHGRGNDEADMLEVAARGVDTMKRKHPDLWKGLVEVNLAPKAVADIIVSVALSDTQGFKISHDLTAAKDTEALMTEVRAVAEEAMRLDKALEAKVRELKDLEKEGKLGPTPPVSGTYGLIRSSLVQDQLFRLRKGHYEDALDGADRLLKSGWFSKVP